MGAAAVQPQRPGFDPADLQHPGDRPGIVGEPCPDLTDIHSLNDVQRLLTVSDWAAHNDEAIVNEFVHEGRMLVPRVLAPDRA